MITITQPQIDAIRWAAERHVRSLERSGSDHEREIKEIQGWIEALENEKCQLSFLRLANLLKMYPIQILGIHFELSCDNTQVKSMIQLVAQQTKTLDRLEFYVQDVLYTKEFRKMDKLVNWLRVFERIDHFMFHCYVASTEVLELIASLPIKSLCVQTDYPQISLSSFIRTNKKIEHLEIVSPFTALSLETFEALKENRTLKVSLSS